MDKSKIKVKHMLKVLMDLNPEADVYVSTMEQYEDYDSKKVFYISPLVHGSAKLTKKDADEPDIVVFVFDPDDESFIDPIREIKKEDNQ